MKKVLVALAISCSTFMLSHVAIASPHFNAELQMDSRHGHGKKGREFRENDQGQHDKRRMREERGVKRLQQLRWQPGYVMPQHYRGNGYKVEYKEHNLPRPDRKQQWYKINNDYILVNSENNSIIRIVGD
ncbi:RcnB family protein [Acinetobacter sp. F9]|uniref:RcnB family protein n=1 Tax=Acinetobacter sp. F9 TaxID=2853158 RepID=UPI001C440D5D|nr:RcnB family protein [Acinetobacter sp. F9]